MKKSKVYTKTGDEGLTGLVSGNRVSKGDPRIDLYGELDELNSRIGVACAHLTVDLFFVSTLDFLHHIQSAIFDLGSNLACEAANREKYKLPQVSSEFVSDLEKEIDRLDHELEPLKNFILPGGSIAAATFHMRRTDARSVERKLISYTQHTGEALPENAGVFLNRLSDYFFVLARYINKHQEVKELARKPHK